MSPSTRKSTDGFTILELIVVLAGLSILSSLAIPNVMRIFDFNNIDEVKALLNTAAADCLQKSRLESSNQDEIDTNILSDKKLSSIGYKIDPGAKNCSYLQLTPTNEKDELRFPIGFAITKGRVTKIATPTTSDEGSINSCENWAGENCKQDEQLKELVAYNKQIQDAKTKCENDYRLNFMDGLLDALELSDLARAPMAALASSGDASSILNATSRVAK